MKRSGRFLVIPACLSILATMSPAPQAQAPGDPSARVAAIKEWIAQSKAALKNYQWIETTVVSVKGEVKSTKVANCYYDVTGTLQKVQTSETGPKAKPGIRGAIQKDEQKDMTAYMDKAVALVKSYMPPSAEKIQASKDAGKMSVDFLPGGSNVRLNFKDYNLPGDTLSVSLNPTTNKPLGFGVSTYIDEPKDVVDLDVTVGTLPDGTGFADKTTLTAKAKNLTVTITNSGYRKAN
jgi:flavin-binding protein dodecin